MSAITFPTRPPNRDGKSPPPGLPLRATGCRCADRLVIAPGRCFRCGQLLPHVISATWAHRAQQIARRAR